MGVRMQQYAGDYMSELYRNPSTTSPLPAPGSDMPVAFWTSAKTRLTWELQSDNTYLAIWRSPMFNLRPDLRSAAGAIKAGVPIFTRSGQLHIAISDLVSSSVSTTKGLRVESAEFAAVTYGQPGNANSSIPRVTAFVDLTPSIMLGTNQPDTVIVQFAPIGGSSPVRFWALEIYFRKDADDWDSDQLIYVEAAYY